MDHSDRRIGGNRLEYRVGDRVVAARGDWPYAGRVNFPIERLNFLDLLFEIVPMRQTYVAQVGDPAEFVRIHAQCEIETPHEA